MDARTVGATHAADAKDAAAPRPHPIQRYQYVDQLLGKRWVVLILGALLEGSSRFSEIATRVGALSDRMLSVRLGELESQGIVERRVTADCKPVRIEYALTAKGRALEPALREITRWADCWAPMSDE